MTTIAPLPPAPLPSDDEFTLNDKMFATFGAYPDFIEQTNALGAEANAAATAAAESQGQAAASAASAEAARLSAANAAATAAANAGAVAWVSDAIYPVGFRAWSLVDQQLYRRITAGSGVIDPKYDRANWERIPVMPDMVTAESFFF